jgi:hypothetical protein
MFDAGGSFHRVPRPGKQIAVTSMFGDKPADHERKIHGHPPA